MCCSTQSGADAANAFDGQLKAAGGKLEAVDCKLEAQTRAVFGEKLKLYRKQAHAYALHTWHEVIIVIVRQQRVAPSRVVNPPLLASLLGSGRLGRGLEGLRRLAGGAGGQGTRTGKLCRRREDETVGG